MQKTLTTRFSIWCAVFLAALGLALTPQLAHAHDVMVESSPEVGSTLEQTPTEVRLRFSGAPLSGEGLANLIRVTDAQGNQWQDGEVLVEGYELAVPLCEALPQGEYTVAYRVIYSDGHTGEERFTFTNADPNAPVEGAPQDCGEAAVETSPSASENTDTNEPQVTSDAEEAAQDNSSASIPAWVWISAGVGVVVVATIVVLLLRGSRFGESDPEDDA
ncbi:MAG TPA: copper resistance CopC family protein [Enteractinococcus sp.]